MDHQLQQMPDFILYELYDALDAMKTLDSAMVQLIYADLMKQHKELVIDALQLVIIEVINGRT